MAFDEAWDGAGQPRPHYEAVLEALARVDLHAACRCVDEHLRARGACFGGRDQRFIVDPVPRILTADEWEDLAAGLEQRVRALETFVRDAYGERAIVAAGVVPPHVIDDAELYEEELRGRLPDGPLIGIAGIDVVRDGDGRFYVLEDNLRTPSGLAYVAAAREAIAECLELPGDPWPIDPVGDVCRVLRTAGERIAVLTDGPDCSAFFEHEAIADALAAPLVTVEELDARGGRLRARGEPVDVVYRRTDGDTLADGRLGELLAEPWLAGNLRLINGFGTGVGDDKLVHAYVEDMIRFYLREEPLVASVATYDPSEPAVREETLERIDELVVKPRAESGGTGVVIGPHADAEARREAAVALRTEPEDHVVQETLWLSEHPTVVDGTLASRHVDLRAFVIRDGERFSAVVGGLTRYACEEGALVVNSSQGGGAKDTWVVG